MRATVAPSPLGTSLLVVITLAAAPAPAQIILPTDATEPKGRASVESTDAVAVSTERIKQILDGAPVQVSGRLLDLTEYVLVVGEPPDLSLFGDDDLARGTAGRSMHAEMRALTTPSRITQAIGSDALGLATAALSTLAPQAIEAIAGWFATEDARPRWAGYTDSFLIGPPPSAAPLSGTVLFHRLEGQRVSLHLDRPDHPTARYWVAVDDQPLGVFDGDIADLTIPDDLLQPGRLGNLHALTVAADETVGAAPFRVDLLVVVHAPEER